MRRGRQNAKRRRSRKALATEDNIAIKLLLRTQHVKDFIAPPPIHREPVLRNTAVGSDAPLMSHPRTASGKVSVEYLLWKLWADSDSKTPPSRSSYRAFALQIMNDG